MAPNMNWNCLESTGQESHGGSRREHVVGRARSWLAAGSGCTAFHVTLALQRRMPLTGQYARPRNPRKRLNSVRSSGHVAQVRQPKVRFAVVVPSHDALARHPWSTGVRSEVGSDDVRHLRQRAGPILTCFRVADKELMHEREIRCHRARLAEHGR